jgi:mRNA-degrading endonuclease toxin of MazEF toxin-antitoxin module
LGVPISEIRRGRILWASLRDKNGYSKDRPCVVVSPDEDIALDAPVFVVAITSRQDHPVPVSYIKIPHDPAGHPITKLYVASWAVTDWVEKIMPDDIRRTSGNVPTTTLHWILGKLA